MRRKKRDGNVSEEAALSVCVCVHARRLTAWPPSPPQNPPSPSPRARRPLRRAGARGPREARRPLRAHAPGLDLWGGLLPPAALPPNRGHVRDVTPRSARCGAVWVWCGLICVADFALAGGRGAHTLPSPRNRPYHLRPTRWRWQRLPLLFLARLVVYPLFLLSWALVPVWALLELLRGAKS